MIKLKPHIVSRALLPAVLLALIFLSFPQNAQAACTRCCNCTTIRNYIVNEVKKHETWMNDTFWDKYLHPALSTMANQISAALTTQAGSVGGFIDAQNNINALRTLQELSAESVSSYAPSEQLCRFGSLGLSLGASDAKARSIQVSLSQRAQNRQLGQANMMSSETPGTDLRARMVRQITDFCGKDDNGGKNKEMCKSTKDTLTNADLDYTRSFDAKPTLDVEFASGTNASSDDEKVITALSDNLFGNDLFPRPNEGSLGSGGKQMNDARTAYMDMRALLAKRSVAQNSFNALVGMKANSGSKTANGQHQDSGAKTYIAGILKELGIDDKSLLLYLGKDPSYNAQMDVLTKKLYQSPAFYVNLMENPANVERQYAAMQSFGLMQQRDLFETVQRSEMLLSLIVEMELGDYQNEVQSRLDKK